MNNFGFYFVSDPFQTITFSVFGYAGCDTYLTFACPNFGRKLSFMFFVLFCIVLYKGFKAKM